MGTSAPPLSATGGSAATQAVDAEARRWTPKRWVSVAIRVIAFVVPFAASFVVARMLQVQLPEVHGPWVVVRWVAIIVGSTAVLVAADRVTRHLLPIAALFQVALVFPDRAPSRYKVALRSGSAARLAEQVRSGGDLGDTQAEAAENALVLLGDLRRHDRLTRGHSERVRAYTDVIAEEMELPQADRDKLRWAALLHDVGKMAVPASILNKPERPTAEEWEQLRGHPAASARILEPLEDWLGPWIGAATEHHERWDGQGYPLGLRGEDISLAGRIVAVADAYDCMTSARSYKKALPPAQARYELSRNSGTQFDPEVVRAFLNVSVGRLHLAGGPLAWLSSVPGARDVATGFSGALGSASGAVAATGAAVVAVAATHLPVVAPEAASVDRPAITAPAGSDEGNGDPSDDGGRSRSTPPSRADDAGGPGTSTTITTNTTATSAPRVQRPSTTPATTAPPTIPPTVPPTRPPTTAPPPRAPAPVDDNRSVRGGTTEDLEVLGNDTDPDGDLRASSLQIVSGPAFGSASVVGQRIRFTAPEVESAQQTALRYRVCDAGGRCATAALRVVITP